MFLAGSHYRMFMALLELFSYMTTCSEAGDLSRHIKTVKAGGETSYWLGSVKWLAAGRSQGVGPRS